MKTYNRAASLLGVLLLSGALAACGSESEPASQTEPADSAATSNDAKIEDPATAPADDEEAAAEDKEAAADDKADPDAKAAGTDKKDAAADKEAAADEAKGGKPSGEASGSGSAADKVAKVDVSKQGKKGQGADRPKTESFQVAGSKETVTGKLQEGYGYALYAMDGLKFDAERNLLTMTSNPDYYATITPLEKGYTLAGLRKEGEKALKDYGTAKPLKEANIPAALSSSRLFLSAEGDAGTGQFALWETPGKGYKLEIHMPSGADAETFAPLAHASLSTLAD
ncbi:hypothetical protein [Saccharibacillus alkalitolerans]|uniref:Lipoprotein n=1 Tax=Saccharibacillus alkalitolerans TaxID=2705290 RepID=A0ABX0F9L0_9BACL|nr:hypothetical protein [Saccharibacillus alkalitolerans]NGZ77632.1 hypothetical protein [Saccharibacillus alkalitolerans]